MVLCLQWLVPLLALPAAHGRRSVHVAGRTANRLRDVLSGVSPALEGAFEHSAHKGAPALLTGCRIPVAIRRRGRAGPTARPAGRSASVSAAAALKEGRKHAQAVIALARRRAGVLWALLRDNQVFTPELPVAQAA